MENPFPLVISIIEDPKGLSTSLLSIGYGTGYLVIQIESRKYIDKLLRFISKHRVKTGEKYKGFQSLDVIGNFSNCSVSFCITNDDFSFHIESGHAVDGFGQTAGLYIPIGHLDDFTSALKAAREQSTGSSLDSYPKHTDQ